MLLHRQLYDRHGQLLRLPRSSGPASGNRPNVCQRRSGGLKWFVPTTIRPKTSAEMFVWQTLRMDVTRMDMLSLHRQSKATRVVLRLPPVAAVALAQLLVRPPEVLPETLRLLLVHLEGLLDFIARLPAA